MVRTKLYKLIITILVIINVGMLIFFFAGRPNHRPPKAGDISAELGIEGEKSTRVTALEKDHHKRKQALMKIDRELHEELFSKIGTDEDVSMLHEEIEANYAEMEIMTYLFFNEVSKQCTPEQAVELKEFIHRAFRQMRGPKK